MRDCGAGAVIMRFKAGLIAVLAVFPAALTAAQMTYVDTYVWQGDGPDFGGFSGVELSADGRSFHVISDRGSIRWGNVERNADGIITHLSQIGKTRLKDSQGEVLPETWLADAEGLATDAQGRLWVSFEGRHRLARFDTPDSTPVVVFAPDEVKEKLLPNAGIEALAVAPDGDVIGIAEHSANMTTPFPVWRWNEAEGWSQPWTIRRDNNWLPTGADFGPDGKLYVLERDFLGFMGFSNRVRRFDWGEDGPTNGVELMRSTPAQYDNLEGISVWHDGIDTRITLISDNNFFFLQRTELVEFRLTETPQPAR